MEPRAPVTQAGGCGYGAKVRPLRGCSFCRRGIAGTAPPAPRRRCTSCDNKPQRPRGRTHCRTGATLRKTEGMSTLRGYPVSHCTQFGGFPAVPFGHLKYLCDRSTGIAASERARVPMASPRAQQSAETAWLRQSTVRTVRTVRCARLNRRVHAECVITPRPMDLARRSGAGVQSDRVERVVCVFLRSCVRACVRACVRVRACVCVCVCVFVC